MPLCLRARLTAAVCRLYRGKNRRRAGPGARGAPPSRWPGRRDRAGVPERPANRGAFGVGADHRGVSSSNYYDSERSDLGVCIE